MRLQEKPMTSLEAMKVFNITSLPDSADLKKLYYKLAKQFHTDTGNGSTEAMQDINNAYEVLSKMKANKDYVVETPAERKQREKEQRIKAEAKFELMKKLFHDSFDEVELVTYLSQFTKDELDISVKESSFMDDYSKKFVNTDMDYAVSYHKWFTATVEVYNKDRSLVYFVKYTIEPVAPVSTGLSSSEVDEDELLYGFDIVTNIFYNNRKQKLAQREYQWRKGKKVLVDYSEVFPKNKLIKLFSTGGKKTFRKADFELGLKRLLPDAYFSYDKDIIFIYAFGRDTTKLYNPYINIHRGTMMRQGYYTYGGLWGYDKTTGKSKFFRTKTKFRSFYETEETMLGIVKAIKEVQMLIAKMKLDFKTDSEEISDLLDKSFDAFVPQSY